MFSQEATIPVSGVSVSPTSVSLNEGGTTQLTATVLPSDATNKNVSWNSNNTSVATVNSSGLVTGVANGSATITVTTEDGGYTATCNVAVSDVTITTITLQENEEGFCSVDGTIENEHSGYTGDGYANTSNADDSGITWSVNVPSSGTYKMAWRYANGGSTNRTAEVLVDGSTEVSNVDFETTGSWSSWASVSYINVNLVMDKLWRCFRERQICVCRCGKDI